MFAQYQRPNAVYMQQREKVKQFVVIVTLATYYVLAMCSFICLLCCSFLVQDFVSKWAVSRRVLFRDVPGNFSKLVKVLK